MEMNVSTSVAIEATTNRDPFDVYIDEVRFIPDNATAVKVSDRYYLYHGRGKVEEKSFLQRRKSSKFSLSWVNV